MRCPRCNQTLATLGGGSHTVNACQGCGGMLISRADLRPYVEALIDAGTLPEPRGLIEGRTNPGFSGERICPKCDQPMTPYNYCYDSNVMLDRCRDCDVIWVDTKEFEPLAAYLKGDEGLNRVEAKLAHYNRMGLMNSRLNTVDDEGRTAHGWWLPTIVRLILRLLLR